MEDQHTQVVNKLPDSENKRNKHVHKLPAEVEHQDVMLHCKLNDGDLGLIHGVL
jgi:hypothetical protein